MPKKKEGRGWKRAPDVDMVDDFKSEDKTNIKKTSLMPLSQRKAEALQLLGGNSLPRKFQFREKQIEEIENYIECCLNKKNKNKYKILMLTGSPGAGKTLSVNYILNKVSLKIIRFNANIIKNVRDVQQLICSQLLNIKYGNNMSTLQIMRFLEDEKVKKKCIIYIEEIQILLEKKADILTEDFFCLFSNPKLNIMLLGVSNTIDAMAKYGKSISMNISDIHNIVFEPYSSKQVAKIMEQKLLMIQENTGLKIIMPEKTLNYAAGKLTNTKKGDVRIVLQFLKSMAALVLPSTAEQCTQSVEEQGFVVSVDTASKILSKMTTSKNELILQLPYQQQVVLIAMYLIIKKTDGLFITQKQLNSEMKWVCDSLGLTFRFKIADDGLEQLEQYSMAGRVKKGAEIRIFLKVALRDIESAFWDHQLFSKFFEEEEGQAK